jgi:hypothetical protein
MQALVSSSAFSIVRIPSWPHHQLASLKIRRHFGCPGHFTNGTRTEHLHGSSVLPMMHDRQGHHQRAVHAADGDPPSQPVMAVRSSFI